MRLTNARDAACALNPARPRVVGRQRLFQIAIKPVELFAKVTRPALKILHRVIRIDAQITGCSRHQLGKSACARMGDGIGAPAALLPDQRLDQAGAEIITISQLLNLGDILQRDTARML